MSESRRRGHVVRVLLGFGIVLIAAGHGVAPLGALLFFTVVDHAAVTYVSGIGVALAIASIFVRRPAAYAPVVCAALAFMGAGFALALRMTEVHELTMATGIPFLCLGSWWLIWAMLADRGTKAASAPLADPPADHPHP